MNSKKVSSGRIITKIGRSAHFKLVTTLIILKRLNLNYSKTETDDPNLLCFFLTYLCNINCALAK